MKANVQKKIVLLIAIFCIKTNYGIVNKSLGSKFNNNITEEQIRSVIFNTFNSYKTKIKSLFHKLTPTKKKRPQKNVWVFVHGTLYALESVLSSRGRPNKCSNEKTFLHLNTKRATKPDTLTHIITKDNGLTKIPISDINTIHDGAANFLLTEFKELLSEITSLSNNDFYIYNWSGILSEIERYKEGIKLYSQLIHLIKQYEEDGYDITIRIVGYSHGGNVALAMLDAFSKKEKFALIKCLILLGTPIYKQTENYIDNNNEKNLFEYIFSFYSPDDFIQKIDIFTSSSKKSYLPKRVLMNSYKTKKYFNIKIDLCLHQQKFKKKIKFSHRELCSLDWNKKKRVCVPFVLFIPYLIESLEQINSTYNKPLANINLDIDVHKLTHKTSFTLTNSDGKEHNKIIKKIIYFNDIYSSLLEEILVFGKTKCLL